MHKFGKRLLFLVFILNTYLFAAEITFTNAQINAGDIANIEINLLNENSIGGFQLQVIDFPNQGYFVDAVTTERTSAFNVSFNEQTDGSVIIVAFDFWSLLCLTVNLAGLINSFQFFSIIFYP